MPSPEVSFRYSLLGVALDGDGDTPQLWLEFGADPSLGTQDALMTLNIWCPLVQGGSICFDLSWDGRPIYRSFRDAPSGDLQKLQKTDDLNDARVWEMRLRTLPSLHAILGCLMEDVHEFICKNRKHLDRIDYGALGDTHDP